MGFKSAPARHGAAARQAAGVAEILAWFQQNGTERQLAENLRYGIVVDRAFGVSVGDVKAYAKTIGRDHARARALFDTGWYEARILAGFTGEPAALTVSDMDRWSDAFDNWAVVDSMCFHLFDRSSLAWGRIPVWARTKPEFKKRAAFAVLWGLSVHDKNAANERFVDTLPIIEAAATDGRNFVKKAVDMALRAMGKRNLVLNGAARDLAARLAASDDSTARWIGRHVERELASERVLQRAKEHPKG